MTAVLVAARRFQHFVSVMVLLRRPCALNLKEFWQFGLNDDLLLAVGILLGDLVGLFEDLFEALNEEVEFTGSQALVRLAEV